MSKADLIVERGAQRLQELAGRAAGRGDGVGQWLAEELTADAAFLRKLKPSLIAARAKGDATANAEPGPQPAAPKRKRRTRGKGPSPLIVVGLSLAAGILAAKVLDWRGPAHPRD